MRGSMESYPRAAVERAMKVQEVILRAIAKKITWFQAAEIAGLSARHMRRLRWRYENLGYDGLLDRRRGLPSERRVPVAVVEQGLKLFREQYYDLNVRHFHEKQCAASFLARGAAPDACGALPVGAPWPPDPLPARPT